MKDSIIIFGGSPFIQKVNLKNIDLNRFDTLAINRPPLNIPIHYVVAYDDDFRACRTQEEVQKTLSEFLNPVFLAPKTEFIHKTTGWNFKKDYINTNKKEKTLGFCLYTCSSAVNFAYLKGYKNVYLIGIDLTEDNKPFTHWHGVTNIKEVPITCARQAKEYIYKYKKWLNIYQCNPEVAPIWQIPYCPIDQLYNHQ